VFAPVRSLGLIVVDEEHDGSYKQEESPRYHGRDVAIVRGSQAGALVVLGSATPAMETFHNAQNGRYELVTLSRRVLDRPMAAVRVVDMRVEYAAAGPDVILSAALCGAVADRLTRAEQSIILLNRRGFATNVFCRQCAATLECPNCSVSLTVHKAAHRARCHYCNYAMGLPKACLNVPGVSRQLGFGTGGSRPRSGRSFRACACRASIETRFAGREPSRRFSHSSRRTRSTCSSARR
jgi:primosomal protein N' (replication factor Y)